MRALIDTGASINITLRPTKVKVFAFGALKPLPIAGMFRASLRHEDNTIQAKVYVTRAGTGCS